MSGNQEFGNLESFRPEPGKAHVWLNYQYAQTCDYTPDPSGIPKVNCKRQNPEPPIPGSLFGPSCEGGPKYTHGNECLRIPAQTGGGSMRLKGFNFITPSVKVRFSLTTDPSIFIEQECNVWGDRETPLKDAQDHFIVDESVNDSVDVTIPFSHPNIPGAPLPAGIYDITVSVANITNAIYDGATPPFLTSNKLLRIEPDPNVKYSFSSTAGWCNRETWGPGGDEIWWDALVGHIVPNMQAVDPSQPLPAELKDIERKSFPREPWEDMNDHEGAGAFSQNIFGPTAFELYGVVAIALIGLEVDSEKAAREQLHGFWNAWGEVLGDVLLTLLGGGSTAVGVGDILLKAGLITAKFVTGALVALVVAALAIILGSIFWALWAPADLIALDIFYLDALTAWDKTDPTKPLPPETQRTFQDKREGEEDNIITVTEHPEPKVHKPGDFQAVWVQKNTYDTAEDGEDASYGLEFRLART